MSFRESLHILIVNEYLFFKLWSIGFDLNTMDFLTSPFIYTETNYLAFTYRFENLIEEILNHTLARTGQVKSKWLMLLIPFIILPLFLIVISYLSYHRYI